MYPMAFGVCATPSEGMCASVIWPWLSLPVLSHVLSHHPLSSVQRDCLQFFQLAIVWQGVICHFFRKAFPEPLLTTTTATKV